VNRLAEKTHKIRHHVCQAGATEMSMRHRLFGFLFVLVLTLLSFVFIILLLTGTFTAGLREAEGFYANELKRIAAAVEKEYGHVSASAVGLSASLSQSIERFLSEKGLGTADLPEAPELLEELLDREFDRMLFSLEKTGVSGAFIVLDATVNKRAEAAEFSRAGLYLKNMEPNIVSSAPPTVTILRGFPDIARERGYSLHAQWDMEFTIDQPPYFFLPFDRAKEIVYPLSRLYYWSEAMTIPKTSEEAMLCVVPLIDSGGNVFGVCGYEVSAMLFKLRFIPDNSIYHRISCMLAPAGGTSLQTGGALFSGNYDAFGVAGKVKPLFIKDRSRRLFFYEQQDGISLVGLHKNIRLYPEDSAFAWNRFAISLLMPRRDLDRLLTSLNIRLIALCALFLLAGTGASVFIGNKYMNPITAGLTAIGSQDIDSIARTNITEIDEIIEQIKARRTGKAPLPDDIFTDFIRRVKTLTPTEKVIFLYYLEGKSTGEILELMYISTNTLKTHNNHIYTKLNISSRNELSLYIRLMEKSGRLSEVK
jgi:DNA-binding CsgD family transcriptional regulator